MKLKYCDINIIATNMRLKIKSIIICNGVVSLYDSRNSIDANLVYRLIGNHFHIMDSCTLELDSSELEYIENVIFKDLQQKIKA